jgi:maltooligosyltrehalose trehalohydrolase
VRFDEESRWLTMTRGTVLVACNLADETQRIPCTGLAKKKIVLCSEEKTVAEDSSILLPANAVAILAGQ